MAYKLRYSDYPGTDAGPPDPERWIGPPGPPGPPGPQGIPGPRTTDVANVLDFGADPTGVADSTTAIRAALAVRPARNAYLPSGTYYVTDSLTVGAGNVSQRLYGDGQGSVLRVDTAFNPAAVGVVILTGTATPLTTHPGVEHLRIQFAIPTDMTATLASASGTTLNLTGPVPTGVVVGDYVTDNTDWQGVQDNFNTMNRIPAVEGSKVVSIGANSVVISLPVVPAHIAAGHAIRFAHPRSMFRALGATPGPSTGVGGYAAQYPWAVYQSGAGETTVDDLHIEGAWNGIYMHAAESFRVVNCSIGALNIGLDIDGGGDGGFVDRITYNAYGLFVPAQTTNTAFGQVFYDGNTIAANFGRCDCIMISNILSFCAKVFVKPTWTVGHILNMDLDFPLAALTLEANTSGSDVLQITNFRGQQVYCYSGATFSNFMFDTSVVSAPGVIVDGTQITLLGGSIIAPVPGSVVVRNVATLYMRDVIVGGPGSGWSGGLIQEQSGSAIDAMGCAFIAGGAGPGLTMANDSAYSVVKSNFWSNTTFTPPGSSGTYEAGLPATQGGIAAAGTTQGTATPLSSPINNVGTVGAGSGVIMPAWAAPGSRWVVWNHGANALLVYIPVGHSIFGDGASQSVAVGAQIVLLYFGGGTWFVEL